MIRALSRPIPHPDRHRLEVSRELYGWLQCVAARFYDDELDFGRRKLEFIRHRTATKDEIRSYVGGFDVVVVDDLPYANVRKDQPPISHDRFATYDARDMAWAEPLGLASWPVEMIPFRYVDKPPEPVGCPCNEWELLYLDVPGEIRGPSPLKAVLDNVEVGGGLRHGLAELFFTGRHECVECFRPIGPGRAGRRCSACRRSP